VEIYQKTKQPKYKEYFIGYRGNVESGVWWRQREEFSTEHQAILWLQDNPDEWSNLVPQPESEIRPKLWAALWFTSKEQIIWVDFTVLGENDFIGIVTFVRERIDG
jgi:hypothetical protein